MQDVVKNKEKEILALKNRLDSEKNAADLRVNSISEQHKLEVKQQKDQVDYYKDLKTKMSTKMSGDTLEIHCSNEFNRVRASMYPNAYV